MIDFGENPGGVLFDLQMGYALGTPLDRRMFAEDWLAYGRLEHPQPGCVLNAESADAWDYLEDTDSVLLVPPEEQDGTTDDPCDGWDEYDDWDDEDILGEGEDP